MSFIGHNDEDYSTLDFECPSAESQFCQECSGRGNNFPQKQTESDSRNNNELSRLLTNPKSFLLHGPVQTIVFYFVFPFFSSVSILAYVLHGVTNLITTYILLITRSFVLFMRLFPCSFSNCFNLVSKSVASKL